MPAVVSYGIRLVSRAICISSVLTSSRSVSRSACSAELFVFCSYSEYLAASEKYRRMQSGRLQKARSLRCRPQTPTRRGSRRDRRCSIAYPPEADRRHRPVMNTAHFDLRSHILRSDRRCSAEGMRSGSAHWNPSSPPARGGGEMLSTPYPLHRPFSTKCRKDFFRKELHTLLGLGIVLCALRCVPMNAAKQRSDHTSCRCFIFCKLTNQTAQAFVSPAREVSSLLYSRASTMALIAARSRTSQARISQTSWTSSDSSTSSSG